MTTHRIRDNWQPGRWHPTGGRVAPSRGTLTRLAPPTVPGSAVARAERRIEHALERSLSPVVTCSMQLGGLVLLDLIRRRNPEIEVLFVDTGFHFPETLAFRDRVAENWNLNLTIATADLPVVEQERRFGRLYTSDPSRCCALRKVEPADAALAGHDLWLAAVRRDQGVTRIELPESLDHALIDGTVIRKVLPLIDWTWNDVHSYADAHGVPTHPLYDQGYSSIGCAPCTTATFGIGDERSGRWNGTGKTECGLHLVRDSGEGR